MPESTPSTSRGKRAITALLLVVLVVVALLVVWLSWQRPQTEIADAGDDGGSASAAGGGSGAEADGGAGARGPDAGTSGPPPSGRARAPVQLSPATWRRDASAPAGALTGRVIAFASGRPVEGADLSFEHAGATHSVTSDADGRFLFSAPERGHYTLAIVTADGFLPFAPEWEHSPIHFEARPGVRVEGVTIYLVNAIEYVATVVDSRDNPVQGAEARVLGAGSGELTLAPIRERYESNAEGKFSFHAPDGAVVVASHPDHGHGRAAVDTPVQVSHRMTIRLGSAGASLTGDRRIAGRVVDEEDQPVDGALVAGERMSGSFDEERELHPLLQATSDEEGAFELRGADDGEYRLGVTAPGFARADVSHVRSGAEDVVVRLAAERALVVVVTDADTGAPLPTATVVVQRARGPLARETVVVASSYDSEGTVEVGGLPPGLYELVAVSHGYAPSEPTEVLLPRPEGPQPSVRIPLGHGGRIVGRIVSADGERPLEGARASLEGQLGGGSAAVPLLSSVVTGPDGRFELAGVQPGARTVVARAFEHHGRLRSGLIVRGGEVTDAGAIDLTPTEEGEEPRIELAGIGAVLSAHEDAMLIGRVIEGGGAAEAGLVPGDAILRIEGVPVTHLGFGGSIERIRGPEGTTVRLTVRRAGGEVVEMTVPRRRIRA